MSFKMKYNIIQKFIPIGTGICRNQDVDITVKFQVVHDIGVINSSAMNNAIWMCNTYDDAWESAHLFVDNENIIETIPCFVKPKKACHVLMNPDYDNRWFGGEANNLAIGTECSYFTDSQKNKEAYARLIWVIAHNAWFHGLTVLTTTAGHFQLCPKTRTDPMNILNRVGKTWDEFLQDVMNEYDECTGGDAMFVESNMSLNWLTKQLKDVKGILKDDGKFYIDTTDFMEKLGLNHSWSKEKGVEVFYDNENK